jgi:hypothetical protein
VKRVLDRGLGNEMVERDINAHIGNGYLMTRSKYV